MANKNFSEIAFYVVAHADDCQIFMYPNIYNDLVASKTKVVIIITTAGDAGFNEIYWRSREEGCKSSIRFCLAPRTTLLESVKIRILNNHKLANWTTNNVSCYFFRLPDGNLDGNGFSGFSFQSLSKLREGGIDKISAVDNSETYNSWSDFYSTLHTIIEYESGGIPQVCINYLNPDPLVNPNDHADHVSTGMGIQDIPIISSFKQVLFTGYSMGMDNGSLSPANLFWKAGMFVAYEKAVYDGSGYSTLKESVDTYIEWSLSTAKFITSFP